MERVEWLEQMREKAEILYNHGVEGFETDEEAARGTESVDSGISNWAYVASSPPLPVTKRSRPSP